MTRRSLLVAAASALALSTLPASAQDTWSAKPVKIISPFPAGGASDVVARMVAQAIRGRT